MQPLIIPCEKPCCSNASSSQSQSKPSSLKQPSSRPSSSAPSSSRRNHEERSDEIPSHAFSLSRRQEVYRLQSYHSVRDAPSSENINTAPFHLHPSPMNYPPAARLPAYPRQEGQYAICSEYASTICSAHPLTSDTIPSSAISPRPTLTSPGQIFLSYTPVIFYYATRMLGLHRVWFSIYKLIPDGRSSDLENAPTSRRSCWTETVQKMKRVWTLIIMVSSLLITLSVGLLQIDNILNNVYPRTFAILAVVLSSASLAASCIFIANEASLDSVKKFRQWEIASRNQHAWSSVDFWACLALPLTSFAWSTGFCLMTLFSLAWVDRGSHTISAHMSKVDLAFSIATIFSVVLCLAFQFYRVQKFLAK